MKSEDVSNARENTEFILNLDMHTLASAYGCI